MHKKKCSQKVPIKSINYYNFFSWFTRLKNLETCFDIRERIKGLEYLDTRKTCPTVIYQPVM